MFKPVLSILLLLLISSCTYIHRVSTKSEFYKTEDYKESNISIDSAARPYREKIQIEMSVIIGSVETPLKKEQPESNLGNWACDAVTEQTAFYTNKNIDFAILNYGGLRIPSIAQGDITKGKIFELMPFDNSLVIIEMQGKDLQSLFSHMVNKGGWPISSNLKILADKNGIVKTVTINNQSIDPDKTYNIASIDYLANGGDNCSFFIGKKQIPTDVLLRDAIIENIVKKHQAGQKINVVKQGRFIIE